VLTAFSLNAAGILFAMHLSAAPIMISATAAASLKVCPFGTSFAARCRCRRAPGGPGSLTHVTTQYPR
jgi:hypothetical protein